MEKFYNILNVGAWVFLGVGVIMVVSGFIFTIRYEGSLEQVRDRMKGLEGNWRGSIRFGIFSIIISIIILIGLS